jgi:thymidine kinase
MAKLHFYYSVMNAGKSTILLQSNYNYHERGMNTLVMTPDFDTRDGFGVVSSRIGLKTEAFPFSRTTDLYEHALTVFKTRDLHCILIDEAHFLTKQQVYQLCRICDEQNIPVLAYGLRTDFQSLPFEGSQFLLALADQLIEIKTICHCGKKATMNIRIDEKGNKVTEGEQVEIGGNDRYMASCRKHFFESR